MGDFAHCEPDYYDLGVAVASEALSASKPTRRTKELPYAARVAEAVSVLVSPVILFYVLRLRPMSPQETWDVARHSMYVFDPRDFILRFSAAVPASTLREGTRVGFLVPARLADVIFGPVPGFFVTRYFFALVTVVPTYVLLRRLYGAAAGVIGIIVIMSSPVLVTAWGTDYPDSAAVSYLAGALACLAMPSRGRGRLAWLGLAGGLLTLAIWSHQAASPLVAAAVGAYAIVLIIRDRRSLLRDAAVLAGAAFATTALLALASGLELGRANFVSVTWRSAVYLGSSSVVGQYHSTSWAWAPYRSYILALPAVVAAWMIVFLRRSIGTPQLVVGGVCGAQVVAAFALQFLGPLWILEFHFFSSLLWGAACVTISVVLAEIARPLFSSRWLRWLPAAAALAVPLVFEADTNVPAFGWWPVGVLLLLLIAAAVWAGTVLGRSRAQSVAAAIVPGVNSDRAVAAGAHVSTNARGMHDPDPAGSQGRRRIGRIGTATWFAGSLTAVTIVILGAGLVLTVAPIPHHPPLKNVSHYDQPTNYRDALGGSATHMIAVYRVESEVPGFVGNSAYPSEQLFIWHPSRQFSALEADIGLYYAGANEIPAFPNLTTAGRHLLDTSRPAEILLMSTTGAQFPVAFKSLSAYEPVRDRTAVLRSKSVVVHLWLIRLRKFMRVG
jgi:hypothetical protein